jgi:hypothetical protein
MAGGQQGTDFGLADARHADRQKNAYNDVLQFIRKLLADPKD